MNLLSRGFVVGMALLWVACQPHRERTIEALANDGEVIIEALELSKAQSGSYPEQLPHVSTKRLKQSKLSDWNYSRSSDRDYQLSVDHQQIGMMQYSPVASQATLAGWFLVDGTQQARFYRSPKVRITSELRLEKGRVGTQNAIPTH